MHVDKWWIIENYYVMKTDYIFKNNLTKSHLFKWTIAQAEISFKSQGESMATMEFHPDYTSNDYECSDNEEITE